MAVYNSPEGLLGFKVTLNGGDVIGTVEQVNADRRTAHPDWAAVHTGLFGHHLSLTPLSVFHWTAVGSERPIPFTEADVEEAPHHDPGADLTVEQEPALFRHHDMAEDATVGSTVAGTGIGGQENSGHGQRRLHPHGRPHR